MSNNSDSKKVKDHVDDDLSERIRIVVEHINNNDDSCFETEEQFQKFLDDCLKRIDKMYDEDETNPNFKKHSSKVDKS